jgi:hypothetical protein
MFYIAVQIVCTPGGAGVRIWIGAFVRRFARTTLRKFLGLVFNSFHVIGSLKLRNTPKIGFLQSLTKTKMPDFVENQAFALFCFLYWRRKRGMNPSCNLLIFNVLAMLKNRTHSRPTRYLAFKEPRFHLSLQRYKTLGNMQIEPRVWEKMGQK